MVLPTTSHVRGNHLAHQRSSRAHTCCARLSLSRPFSTFKGSRISPLFVPHTTYSSNRFAFHCWTFSTSVLTFFKSPYVSAVIAMITCVVVALTSRVSRPSTRSPSCPPIRSIHPPVSTSSILVPLGLHLARSSLTFSCCLTIYPSKIPPLQGPSQAVQLAGFVCERLHQQQPTIQSCSALTTYTLVLMLGLLPHWSSYQPLMMNLHDELASWVTDGLTVVVALELDFLVSFSASAASLIESSSTQTRSNLDLHASECPPGQT